MSVLISATAFLVLWFYAECISGIARVRATELCDCGVIWSGRGVPGSSTYNHAVTLLNYATSGTNYALPSAVLTQPQFICGQDLSCSGIFYSIAFGTAYAFTALSSGAFSATVGLNDATAEPLLVHPESFVAYTIDRTGFYICPDLTLDPYYYYFVSGARDLIESSEVYCPYLLSDGTCCWHSGNPPCDDPANRAAAEGHAQVATWTASATRHWLRVGHILRLNPNVGCKLSPTILTQASSCTAAPVGCFRSNCDDPERMPCGNGNGACVATEAWETSTYSTPFHCLCRNFTSDLFGGIPQYMGISCEHSSSSGCRFTEDSNEMCHGDNTRCRPADRFTENCQVTGFNDVAPVCDCSSAPAVSGSGEFCEVDRCDPTNRCQVHGVGSSCVHVGPGTLDFACQCSGTTTGNLCQYLATTCILNGGPKCSNMGTCMPPGLPATSDPNYSGSQPWCNCTAGRSYGLQCQNLACDPALVTAGRGLCDNNGNFQRCYFAYESSGLAGTKKCDVDRCARFGGTPTGNPPDNCDCGGFFHGVAPDTTCYPRCPLDEGVECGPGGACQRSQSPTPSLRYAYCLCDTSTHLAVVTNTTTPYERPDPTRPYVRCDDYCIHGTLPPLWDANHPTACLCDNTGYDTRTVNGVRHLRCDYKICQNGGTWNTVTRRCDCLGPYSSSTECAVNSCDDPTTAIVEGVVISDPAAPSAFICSCNPPFTNPQGNRLSCAANLCVPFGVVNPAITAATNSTDMCTCAGVRATSCANPRGTGCAFCTTHKCQHGGAIEPIFGLTCVCVFPYTDGALCAGNLCGLHGTPGSGMCTCLYGWTGILCTASPCTSAQAFNETTHACYTPPRASSSSTFSSSSTGHSSSSSSSSTGAASTNSSSAGEIADFPSSTAAAAAAAAATSSSALSTTSIALISGGGAVALAALAYAGWLYYPQIASKLGYAALSQSAPAAVPEHTEVAVATTMSSSTGPLTTMDVMHPEAHQEEFDVLHALVEPRPPPPAIVPQTVVIDTGPPIVVAPPV